MLAPFVGGEACVGPVALDPLQRLCDHRPGGEAHLDQRASADVELRAFPGGELGRSGCVSVAQQDAVDGFVPALVGSVVISLVSWLLSVVLVDDDDRR